MGPLKPLTIFSLEQEVVSNLSPPTPVLEAWEALQRHLQGSLHFPEAGTGRGKLENYPPPGSSMIPPPPKKKKHHCASNSLVRSTVLDHTYAP